MCDQCGELKAALDAVNARVQWIEQAFVLAAEAGGDGLRVLGAAYRRYLDMSQGA